MATKRNTKYTPKNSSSIISELKIANTGNDLLSLSLKSIGEPPYIYGETSRQRQYRYDNAYAKRKTKIALIAAEIKAQNDANNVVLKAKTYSK